MKIRFSWVLAGSLLAFPLLLAIAYFAFEIYVFALPAPDLARASRSSTIVLAENRRPLTTYLAEDDMWRLPVTVRDVPSRYLAMLIAYEDRRFFEHRGIDIWAVLRAGFQWLRNGRIVSGASTLTMQTVRLLEKDKPGSIGKLRQAALAVKLERALDKEAILSLYLTLAPFGGNIEGVRAASLHYFGIEPRDLSVAQSALLVAIPQAPERRRPGAKNPAKSSAAREARDWVLAQLAARGVLSREEVAEALNQPIPSQRRGYPFLAHQLSDRLRTASAGKTVLHTLIDYPLQAQIEAMTGEFASGKNDSTSAAVVVVRRADLAVRAYVSGPDYFDADRAGMVDLVRAIRSPGSVLKPVIYGLAFEDLIVHPDTIMADDFVNVGGYAPENFDKRYRGEVLVREALTQSLNTAAVVLLNEIGPDRFLARLRVAGANVELPDPNKPAGLAIALGGLGISLENAAKLFAGIANGGKTHALRYLVDTPVDGGVELMTSAAAWAVTDILADMPPARGRIALLSRAGGRRVAYKTGTSYGFKDAWAIGFDSDHVVAVWVGRPDGIGRSGETGAINAVPIMQRIFELLPAPARDVAADRPRNSVLTRVTDLPDRLKRFTPRGRKLQVAGMSKPFEIRFPIDGSTIRLSGENGSYLPLTLWATGGRPPFRWYVDGRSLMEPTDQSTITWIPEGRGQIDIMIVDAEGSRASSTAWLE